MIGIYCITNLINDKKYIGQSLNIQNRWREHKLKPFRNCWDKDKLLYKAIRKYGLENFNFEILEECKIEELDEKEKYWIKYYQTYPPEAGKGYNENEGGCTGYRKLKDKEIKEIISLLKDTNISQQEIAKKFNVHFQTINYINNGRYNWHIEGIEYPIRIRKFVKFNVKKNVNFSGEVNQLNILKEENIKTCPICGNKIYKKSKVCKDCRSIFYNLKITPPSYEELFASLYELRNMEKVAQKYNVSSLLIQKWCRDYNINPQRKNDLIEKYEVEFLGKEPKKHIGNYGTKVAQLDPNTKEVIQIFKNKAQAVKNCNSKSPSNITRACNTGGKAFGYYWKYIK